MIRAFRLTKTRYVETAFDGEGARLHGGRWNSIGTSIVYTASTLSLATLELLVHLENPDVLYGTYSVIPVEFGDSLVANIDADSLPDGWDAPQTKADTRRIGDDWVRAASSVVLAVPSAVTFGEVNYLLNPAHPDFDAVEIRAAFAFEADARLGGR